MPSALEPGIVVETGSSGAHFLLLARTSARHQVPTGLMDDMSAAVAAGEVEPGPVERWLELRQLLRSERGRRVEAWSAARAEPAPAPKPPGALPIVLFPDTRFSCHGCGACCEAYLAGPVTEAERAGIMARAAELAAHVATPQERWFTPHEDTDGSTIYALGRQPSGACVFLGADKLCEVHRRIGAGLKPLVCRRFPLLVTRRPDATVVTMRIECESLARSRRDGAPLEDQGEWVREVVAEVAPSVVPRVVRVEGDLYIPYSLARTIERRALGFLGAAPTVEQGLLAVRDLVFAVLATTPPAPDPDDLSRAEDLAATAELPKLRSLRAPVERSSAVDALGGLLELLLTLSPKFLAERAAQLPEGQLSRANDRLAMEILAALFAALAERFSWPAHLDVPAEALEAGRRAFAVGSGASDPAVVDFVRSCAIQMVGGSRPLVATPGLIYGHAQVALEISLARFGARVLADRRGASSASPEDWNRSLALFQRLFRILDLAAASRELLAFYANLFATDDLPT